MNADWEMQEPGWYTGKLGGIAEEEPQKWFFYPRDHDTLSAALGPWKTLKLAKAAAAQHTNGDLHAKD